MRRDESNAECPRLSQSRRGAQVFECCGFHLVVGLDHRCTARASFENARPRLVQRWAAIRPWVHRVNMLFCVGVVGKLAIKPVKLVLAEQVHLAVESGVVTGGSQQVGPGERIDRQRLRVVPALTTAHVLPGHERSAGWNAERCVAVSVIESDAHFRDAVHRGRLYKRVPVCPRKLRPVLVGHYDQEIRTITLLLLGAGWTCRHCISSSIGSTSGCYAAREKGL